MDISELKNCARGIASAKIADITFYLISVDYHIHRGYIIKRPKRSIIHCGIYINVVDGSYIKPNDSRITRYSG